MRKTGFGSFRAPAQLTSANDNNMQIVVVSSDAWELSFLSMVAYSNQFPYPLPTDLNRPQAWRMIAVVGEIPTDVEITPLGDQLSRANIQREIFNMIGQPGLGVVAPFPKGGGPIIEAGEQFTAAMGKIFLADGNADPNTVCHLTVWGRKLSPEGGTPNVILR